MYASLLLCCTVSFVQAQWTSNAKQNTPVAYNNSSDIQTANTNDGKTWIAFYSQNGNNYDMRAQLLDENGNRLLGDSGVLVSNKKSGSATFVFNVCVDNKNDFIIAFQYEKNKTYECIAQKINKQGELLWGKGVDLGEGLAPYPVTLTTNEIAVAWSNNNRIDYQKLSASGNAAWPSYKELPGTSNVSRPQLLANANGNFGMIYQQLVSFPFYTNLYAQRFKNNGDIFWDSAVRISKLVTASYRYFDVMAEADTMYAGYYGNPSASNRFDAYVQRILPDGSLPYGINGSAFSSYSGSDDINEQTIYIAKAKSADNIWAVCTFSNSLQTASGVYVQSFLTYNGKKLLPNKGKMVLPISEQLTSLAFSKLSLCDNKPLFLITDNTNKLSAIKLNSSGNFAWIDSIKTIGRTTNAKSRYGFTDVYEGQAVAVWQEDKGNGDMPYAQNIRCDESTGPASNVAKHEAVSINSFSIKNIYPNPVQNVLSAIIASSVQSSVHVYITDVNGNILRQSQQNIQKGNNLIQLNVGNLKAGSYFIKVMNGDLSAGAVFSK